MVRKPKTSQFRYSPMPISFVYIEISTDKVQLSAPRIGWWEHLLATTPLGVSVKYQKSVQWLDHGWTSRLVNLRFLSCLTPKLIVFILKGQFFQDTSGSAVFSHGLPVLPTQIAAFRWGLHEADESRELSWLMSSEGIDEFWGYYMTYCLLYMGVSENAREGVLM